jgi:hypothetical protein
MKQAGKIGTIKPKLGKARKLTTEEPISEKDEVKKAEERLRKGHGHK